MRSAIRLAVTVPGDIQEGPYVYGRRYNSKRGRKKVLMSCRDLKTAVMSRWTTNMNYAVGLFLLGRSATKTGGNFPCLERRAKDASILKLTAFTGAGGYRLVADAKYNDNPDLSLGQGQPQRLFKTKLNRSLSHHTPPQPLLRVLWRRCSWAALYS
jgi:hypothetical protein